MKAKRGLVPAVIPLASSPSPFTSSDAIAMQAVASGKADEQQQRHALDWILKSGCGLPVWAYRENQRETDIALGRQFVGQQIMGLLNANISLLRKYEGQPAPRGDSGNA